MEFTWGNLNRKMLMTPADLFWQDFFIVWEISVVGKSFWGGRNLAF